MSESKIEKVIIVGSGPAGYTAGLYSARANLSPLLFTGIIRQPDMLPGGQLMTTTEVENYPGFENGIMGPELMDVMKKQAARFGCRMVDDEIVKFDISEQPFKLWDGQDNEYRSWTIIICTGARPRRLGIPGENELFARGVSTCAVCDGAFFREKTVCVIGGGDSAMEESLYLTHHCSKVYVIHRRDELRASKIMQQRAFENEKIEFVWDTIPVGVLGDNVVTGTRLKNVKTVEESKLPLDGFFLAIGHTPNTDIVKGLVALEESGYIIVDDHQHCMDPNDPSQPLEAIFAAGDCHDHTWRQAITAAGFGCKSALASERYLATIADKVNANT